MAIVLSNRDITITKKRNGQDAFNMVAGETLKVETSPGGEDILEVTVPAGKRWSVRVGVRISERDA